MSNWKGSNATLMFTTQEQKRYKQENLNLYVWYFYSLKLQYSGDQGYTYLSDTLICTETLLIEFDSLTKPLKKESF